MRPIVVLGPAVLVVAACAVTVSRAGDGCEGHYTDRFPPANYLDLSPLLRVYRMDTDGDGPLPERTVFVGGNNEGGGVYGSLWGTPGSSPFQRSTGFQVHEGGLILPMPATNSVGGRPLSAAAAFDPDGAGPAPTMVYVGGANVGTDVGVPYNRTIARYDGASWSTLPEVAGVLDDMVVFDEDGAGPLPARLFIAGTIARTGEATSFLLRFDGTSWTDVGVGLNGRARVLLVADPDGDGPLGECLIVGGEFSNAGGSSVSRIAAWDGANWHALGQGVDATVRALVMHDDDGDEAPSLFIGGDFANADGSPAMRVAKFAGRGWLSAGANFSGQVKALASFDDDDDGAPTLFAGGKGLLLTGETGSRAMHRLDDGIWRPVDENTSQTSGEVRLLAVLDPDDEGPRPRSLITGGLVSSYRFKPGLLGAFSVMAWDGELWTAFDESYGVRTQTVTQFDLDGDPATPSQLVVAGEFGYFGGVHASNIAAFDGSNWHPLGDGLDGLVYAMAEFDPDGPGGAAPVLVAGGVFAASGSTPLHGAAMWNGSAWVAMGEHFASVLTLAVVDHDDAGPTPPTLYASGYQLDAPDGFAHAVSRWTGAEWQVVASRSTVQLDQATGMCGFDPDGPGPSPRLLMVSDRNGDGADPLFSFDGASFTRFPSTLPLGEGEFSALMVEFVDPEALDEVPLLIARRSYLLYHELVGPPTELRIGRWRDGVTTLMPRIDYPPFQPGPGVPEVPGEVLNSLTVIDPDGPGPMAHQLYACVGDLNTVGIPPLWQWTGSGWLPKGAEIRFPIPCDSTPWDPDGEGPSPTSVVYSMGGELVLTIGERSTVLRGLYEWIPSVPATLIEAPHSLIVRPGDPASFKVLAVGTDASIDWRKDNAPLPDGVFGTERSWVIAIDSATVEDRGHYDAVIANGCAEVTSAAAELRVRVLEGDANADTVVDFNDITDALAHWGNNYNAATGPGDADSDGTVTMNDLTAVLKNWLAQEEES